MVLPTTKNRNQRILAVTAGLAATGAVVGAVCAAIVLTGSILGETFFPWNPYRNVIPGVIVCGWLGFLLAGILLWIHSRVHA